jgi:uncharacterized membrane protein
MVDDSAFFDVSAPRASAMPRLVEVGYFAFLLLIFVGLQPFAVRDGSALIGAEAATGAGDALRQFAFATVFGLIVFASVREKGYRAFAAVPPVLALLLVWCLISSLWSPEPGISLRRAALESVIVLSAMMSASALGPARSFQIFGWVLAGVLVVNWLSIPVIHQAVHLPGDSEPQLVGDWRGLYFHKNIAGAVSAISAIVFFFRAWDRQRWIDIAVCIAAIGFAIMTRSKSSLALLPVALAAGTIYRLACWSRSPRVRPPHFCSQTKAPSRGFSPIPRNSPAAPRSGRPSCPSSAIIPGWARASAHLPTREHCRRCTTMSAATG